MFLRALVLGLSLMTYFALSNEISNGRSDDLENQASPESTQFHDIPAMVFSCMPVQC